MMSSISFDWSDMVERWSLRWSGMSSSILPAPLRRRCGAVPSPCTSSFPPCASSWPPPAWHSHTWEVDCFDVAVASPCKRRNPRSRHRTRSLLTGVPLLCCSVPVTLKILTCLEICSRAETALERLNSSTLLAVCVPSLSALCIALNLLVFCCFCCSIVLYLWHTPFSSTLPTIQIIVLS